MQQDASTQQSAEDNSDSQPAAASASPCSGLQDACSATSASEAERQLYENLPDSHLIHRLMTEHLSIREDLEKLELLAEELLTAKRPEEPILKEISAAAERLIGAEPHHQREEQVLFPELGRRGVVGPPEVMTAEHVTLRAFKHSIKDRAVELLNTPGGANDDLIGNINELVFQLRNHIFKENNILYPMALGTIRDEADWADLAERADQF